MRVSINIVNSFKKKYNLIVILLGFLQVDMVKKGGSLQWEGMAFTHPFKISALFPRAKRVTVALFITLEVSHFLVWQDVLCWGGCYRCGEISFQVFYLIFSSSASLYFNGQPWDNGITLCLPHQALDECTEASSKRNKMAVKMQTLKVKKGVPNN